MEPGQDVHATLAGPGRRRWWLADGRGAIAHGTVSGAATSRVHALLAAPQAGPCPDRPSVSLLRFDDRVMTPDGASLELTPAFVLASRGDDAPSLVLRGPARSAPASFASLPWPRWRFAGPGWRLEREYRLVEGHAALIATWRLIEGGPIRVHVAPLLVARTLEGLQRETPEFRGAVSGVPGRVRCGTLEGHAPLTLWYGGAFMPARAWHRGLAYPDDAPGAAHDPERGITMPAEDAFLPGWMQAELPGPGAALHVVASPEEHLFRTLAAEQRLGTPPARTLAECVERLDLAEEQRRACWHDRARAGAAATHRQAVRARVARSGDEDEPPPRAGDALSDETAASVARLATRLHDSILERADRTAVLTHPETLTESGPDALRVAAALVTLREFGLAGDIARGYLAYVDEGLAPERFGPDGLPHYGSPETSLWLVHVVDLLARRDDDPARVRAMLEGGAYAALEGVLQHLRAGSRHGVRCDRDGFLWAGEGEHARTRADLNALWYHALVAMSQLAKLARRREHAAFYLAWARELQRSFADQFWDEAVGALHPWIAPGGVRARGVEPSQFLSVALPPPLLVPERAPVLVATLTRELFDARGLRPRPHDGTPDAGALAAWAAATLRAHGRDDTSRARVTAALTRWSALGEPGVDRRPAAAADLLRVWVEDLAFPADVAAPVTRA